VDGVVVGEFDGARSTSALGRHAVAQALRDVDPVGSRGARSDTTSWRQGYVAHFRRMVEAGLLSREAALTIARDGLAAVHDRMRYRTQDGEVSLDQACTGPPHGEPIQTMTVAGGGDSQRELVLPYRGARLRGADLDRQLDRWLAAGVIEPSCAEAVRTVAANPDALAMPDHRIVVLGAGAEMGPLTSLLRWGADVVAVDLPRRAIWERVFGTAKRYGGRLRVPVPTGGSVDGAGADLLHDLPRVGAWLEQLDGRIVLGNYVYADGVTNLRVATAVDVLTTFLLQRRADLALGFLATPTDVFAVPADAVAEANRRYAGRSPLSRPLRVVSAGRLLTRNYPPSADPGINDSLVPQQGPNYALAKRLQRWRAVTAREAGTTVSLNVAPATRTRSVLRNRLLASAYAGAHRFGIEIFEPATSNTLMAALLVYDLYFGRPVFEHPWQDEAFAAAHGGLWRQAYAPRSALGIAVLLGFASARG
jgi:hypothetical protein